MERNYITSEKLRANFSSSFDLVNYAIRLSYELIEEAKEKRRPIDENIAVEVIEMVERDIKDTKK